MKLTMKAYTHTVAGLFGLFSFLLYSFSFLIGYGDEGSNSILILIKAGILFLSALFFVISGCSVATERLKQQYSILCIVILMYQALMLLAVGWTILSVRYYTAILSSLLWIISALWVFLFLRKSFIKWLSDLVKDRDTVILIIAALLLSTAVIVLSAEPEGVRFSWDSDTLYGSVYGLDFSSLYDVKQTVFHSHVSAVYIHILILLKLLTNNIRTAFFILNSLCIVAAAFGMIFLLRRLVPGKKIPQYVLSTSLFLLSPWVCGLSTYHIYDYYIWCLYPLLMYYCCANNWIGFLTTGVMITFSKASGLIVFGSVCLGIVLSFVICGIKKDGIRSLKSILSCLIRDIKNWYFISVALIFFVFFKLGVDKGTQFEDTRFGINLPHITHILKLFMTANYLWIFSGLSAVLLILIFVCHKNMLEDGAKRYISVLVISDLVFVLFNCLCITFRLPRYMDSHIAVVYICGAVMLLCLGMPRLSAIISVIICVVTFTGSFRMTDPVSMRLFKKLNTGDHSIVDFEKTDSPSLGDSVICNREYYSYEVVLGRTLSYIMADRKAGDEILFSLGDQDLTWGFSGGRYSYSFHEDMFYFELFYDKTIKGLANGEPGNNWSDPDMIPFEMRYIFPQETIEEVLSKSSADCFYYIYMPSMNEKKERELLDNYIVEEQKDFRYRGWDMNCVKFRSDGSV